MTVQTGSMSRSTEVAREQALVATFYARLDELRDQARERLSAVLRQGASGTPQNRSERDLFAIMYSERLVQLEAVEPGLCFGRLDLIAGERLHVGRLGLTDERLDTLLVDWRAPAAEPFYRATPTDSHGVIRRRHLRTRGREVLDVEDDIFDIDGLTDEDRETLGGGGALLAALTASRTGRMRDIVATIQAEQDRVIRAEPSGVLVVQGGPGTGKTAVALHRAAYLLYTHRERLARSGVLVVGPGLTFLRYIEQVLPSLGETGVVLSTLGGLLPGVTVTATEPTAVAQIKSELRMAELVEAAIAARQRVPREPRTTSTNWCSTPLRSRPPGRGPAAADAGTTERGTLSPSSCCGSWSVRSRSTMPSWRRTATRCGRSCRPTTSASWSTTAGRD
jgi:DNA helicase IV